MFKRFYGYLEYHNNGLPYNDSKLLSFHLFADDNNVV